MEILDLFVVFFFSHFFIIDICMSRCYRFADGLHIINHKSAFHLWGNEKAHSNYRPP